MNSGDDEADKLARRFDEIQQVLRGRKPIPVMDPWIKIWFEKVTDISYEIEDMLYERNMRLHEDKTSPWKVCSFLDFVCLCSRRVFGQPNINSNIKQLNRRLDLIDEEYMFGLLLRNRLKATPNYRTGLEFRTSTSFVCVSEVYGRDDDKESVVSKLLCEDIRQMRKNVPVISILGGGGTGKTTLAQIVFNDDRVRNHFEERVWVCCSNPCNEVEITKAILGALNYDFGGRLDFETLFRSMVDQVSGKNLLLLLDDLCIERDTLWEPIIWALNYGGPKSRILVTTRNARVALKMGSSHMQTHLLHPLSDSHCWTLFRKVAFCGRTQCDVMILEETGLEIVKKCKGLPLAAEAIGRFLNRWDLKEWQMVLHSQVWEWQVARTKIFPLLELSFDGLDHVAKRCFSFCAILPKDDWINVAMLIRMWCAQGFLSSDIEGREVFDNLSIRCFFQHFIKDLRNQVVYCKIYDIVHEFARFLSRNNKCLIVENDGDGAMLAYGRTTLHLNVLMGSGKINPIPTLCEILHEDSRSFLITGGYNCCIIPKSLLHRVKRVRVLSLPYCELEVSQIACLMYLRYLDLTGSSIKELPETICNLYNLETLILVRCVNLSELPQGIHKLRRLRHLLNDGTSLELPERFDELTNLWTFSKVSVGPMRNRKKLWMLRNMKNLLGCLSIHVVDLEDEDEAEKANLQSKHLIEEMYLCFGGKVKAQVMEALQPHSNLHVLTFSGPYLPKWASSLCHLLELTISITKVELTGEAGSFSSLPPLGKLMPFLEVLWLFRMVGMECLSHVFLGIDRPESVIYGFRKLKRLTFSDCKEWDEWEDISKEEGNNVNISIFPSLECLELYNCRKLQTLPHRLLRKASSLKHLIIDGCDNLDTSFKDWGKSLTDSRICRPPNCWSYRNIVMDETDEQAAYECLSPDVIHRGKLREQIAVNGF